MFTLIRKVNKIPAQMALFEAIFFRIIARLSAKNRNTRGQMYILKGIQIFSGSVIFSHDVHFALIENVTSYLSAIDAWMLESSSFAGPYKGLRFNTETTIVFASSNLSRLSNVFASWVSCCCILNSSSFLFMKFMSDMAFSRSLALSNFLRHLTIPYLKNSNPSQVKSLTLISDSLLALLFGPSIVLVVKPCCCKNRT